jgi:hypothetical protein
MIINNQQQHNDVNDNDDVATMTIIHYFHPLAQWHYLDHEQPPPAHSIPKQETVSRCRYYFFS